MTEIFVDGKSVPDGITNDNGLRIGIAWHRNVVPKLQFQINAKFPINFKDLG